MADFKDAMQLTKHLIAILLLSEYLPIEYVVNSLMRFEKSEHVS